MTQAARWPWRTSADVTGAARGVSRVTGKPDRSLEHPDSRFTRWAPPGTVEYYTALKINKVDLLEIRIIFGFLDLS